MSARKITRRNFMEQGAAVGTAGLLAGKAFAGEEKPPDTKAVRSYNPKMEYRRLGKTNIWISAIALGGHWKRCPYKGAEFAKNRADIVNRCLDAGINYVDACWDGEVIAYGKAVNTIKRRDDINFGFSFGGKEMRFKPYRTTEKLLETLENGLKKGGLEYADLWRITMHEKSSRHTEAEVEQMMGALAKAKKQGKARFVGFSSHDRPHIEWMVKTYKDVVDVVVTPYTAKTKEKGEGSFFDTLRQLDIRFIGIKPFASNSIFKGKSGPDDPNREEDDKRARMALRYILCNNVIAAPIPGLIFPHHVENCVRAIAERRKEDLIGLRPAILDDPEFAQMADEMWDRLPKNYQWLKDWEWV